MFSKLCRSAIVGRFGTHSLRRVGVSVMSKIGIPLAEIKDRAMWASPGIFDYVLSSFNQKYKVDKLERFLICFFFFGFGLMEINL